MKNTTRSLQFRNAQFTSLAIVLAIVGAATVACSSSNTEDGDDSALHSNDASDVVFLDQGWTEQDRAAWETTSDGSSVIPAPWLLALEKADSEESFLSDANVRSYGLIPSPRSEANPYGLPVGYAKQAKGGGIGTTCSACHEAQITYKGKTVRVHGGQGKGLTPIFTAGMYGAIAAMMGPPPAGAAAAAPPALPDTAPATPKFARFAQKVVAMPGVPWTTPEELWAGKMGPNNTPIPGVKAILTRVLAEKMYTESHGISYKAWGPYRQDAVTNGINMIAKKVTGAATPTLENIKPIDAAVSLPAMWGTADFDWVEYNSAFRQPMARNIVSTLARNADIVFTDDPRGFPNSVDMEHLFQLESLVHKLRAPKWPDFFPAIDRAKAEKGHAIYQQACAGCHEPGSVQVGSLTLLKIKTVPISEVGTDPLQATYWATRKVDMKGFAGMGEIPAAQFAELATQKVMDFSYAQMNATPERIDEMNGFRKNEWTANLAYRARPLDGVWATAPYLHNGSVPNLKELLTPPEKRPAKFFVGEAEFDPEVVGLVSDHGEYELDTAGRGNSNAGHPYGTDLPNHMKVDLIEYLKTR
jgi:mono/diheme cytochrome c family protein